VRIPDQHIESLVAVMKQALDLEGLRRLIDLIGKDLEEIAVEGVKDTRIRRVVAVANREGWSETLVHTLRDFRSFNQGVQAVMSRIEEDWANARPLPWYEPADPVHSLFIFHGAFLDRENLRTYIRELLDEHGRRKVLVVDGGARTGKTYTWHYLKYLEEQRGGFRPIMVDFKDWPLGPSATELMQSLAYKIGITETVPDYPYAQPASKATLLTSWFIGQIGKNPDVRLLIVYDSVDFVPPAEDVRSLIDGLVRAAHLREAKFGLVLLGCHDALAVDDQLMLYDKLLPIDKKAIVRFLGEVADHRGVPVESSMIDLAAQSLYELLSTDEPAQTLLNAASKIEQLATR
jgi:hypothetical protein